MKKEEERPAAPAPSRVPPSLPTGDDTILAYGAPELRLAQELRLHRIELEVQHEELRSTQGELEAARDRFADLYELSPVAFFTTTASGTILELNGAGAWLLERPRPQAVGLPLTVTAGFAAAPLLTHLRACVASSDPVTVELDLVPPSGRRCRVQLTSRSVHGPRDERLCLVAVTDVSAHRRTEERLRLRADAGAALLGATAVPEVIDRLTRVMVPTVADLCVLDLVVGAGDLRRRAGVFHVDPARGERFEDSEERWGTLPNVGFATLQALQTGRSQLLPMIAPKYYESAAVDDEHLTALVGLVLRSWAVVPVLDPAGGRPLGVLRIASGGVRRPLDAEDVALAEQVAHLGALAITATSARTNLLTDAALRAEHGRMHVRTLEDAVRVLVAERTPGRGGASARDVTQASERARGALAELKAAFGASSATPPR